MLLYTYVIKNCVTRKIEKIEVYKKKKKYNFYNKTLFLILIAMRYILHTEMFEVKCSTNWA